LASVALVEIPCQQLNESAEPTQLQIDTARCTRCIAELQGIIARKNQLIFELTAQLLEKKTQKDSHLNG
jgi:hypothetical protein